MWAANSPWIGSGYGAQTALFAPRLRDLGHEVILFANYGLTGAGQGNSDTGEVYQYAGGFHGMISTPRRFTAGESGPERVDITPGMGGSAGGGSNGATINVSFNTLVPPSDFEMQQAARRLKRYLDRDN